MLNEHQRRRLGVRFSRLITEAEGLAELLAQSAEPGQDRSGEPLDSEATRVLAAELSELIVTVRATATRFAIPLDSNRLPAERQVEFWAALWQTRVLDCRPARLRGSGPVSRELVEALGPAVDRIAKQLERLRDSAVTRDRG